MLQTEDPRKTNEYQLDVDLHGPDCLWRTDPKHDACSHEDQCEVDTSAWHTCGSPEHMDFGDLNPDA